MSGSPTAPEFSKISVVCAASDVASTNNTKSWPAHHMVTKVVSVINRVWFGL